MSDLPKGTKRIEGYLYPYDADGNPRVVPGYGAWECYRIHSGEWICRFVDEGLRWGPSRINPADALEAMAQLHEEPPDA